MDSCKPICKVTRENRRPKEEQTREFCSTCVSCLKMQNIPVFTEQTPLLPKANQALSGDEKWYDVMIFFFFMTLLMWGSGIGTYLMIVESKATVIEEFDFVSRDHWTHNTTNFKDLPPLSSPASKILFFPLTSDCRNSSKRCLTFEEYLQNNREKMKVYGGDVKLNFYQDRQGRIFEGRGWGFQGECLLEEGCADVITIGLIDFSFDSPSQSDKLKAFLDYCVMDKALKKCFEVMVRHDSDRSFEDLATYLKQMTNADGCKQYLT